MRWQLTSIREIADEMGVSYVTLYGRIRKKGIRPVKKVGATFVFDYDEIKKHFVAINGRIYDVDEARKILNAAEGGI